MAATIFQHMKSNCRIFMGAARVFDQFVNLGVSRQVDHQIGPVKAGLKGSYFRRVGHALGQVVLQGGDLICPGTLAFVNADNQISFLQEGQAEIGTDLPAAASD